jgi:hypothetical protein
MHHYCFFSQNYPSSRPPMLPLLTLTINNSFPTPFLQIICK